MTKSTFVATIATLTLASPALAQQPDYPDLSADQRWDRVTQLGVLGVVAAIRHAKDMGQDLNEFEGWWVDLFDDSWGEPGNGTPMGVMGGMRRNHLAFQGGEVEILEASQERITARFNAFHTEYFGEDGVWYGVTIDEYEDLYSGFIRGIAEYKGLAYEERREDGHWVLTFSRR